MTVYMIADLTLTDGAWIPDYAANVHPIVTAHGGRYLARSGNITSLEGAAKTSTVVAIVEFPDAAACLAFVNDPAYAPYKAARGAGTQSQFFMIDNTDLVGSIPYLPPA